MRNRSRPPRSARRRQRSDERNALTCWRGPQACSGRFRSSANLDLTHALSQPPHHSSPKAADDVVVDHANRLHESIADGRPYEAKSALDQVTAQHSGLLRLSRDLLEPSPSVLDGYAAHELPHVAGEAATLALNDKEGAGIGDRGLDLGAIAYNAVVLHQALNICFRELRQLGGIEARKHSAVGLALSENGEPAQTRLRSLEDQKLEKPTIVVLGHTPLLIVVADVQRIPSPAAAAPHCPSSCMEIITNLWSRSTRNSANYPRTSFAADLYRELRQVVRIRNPTAPRIVHSPGR